MRASAPVLAVMLTLLAACSLLEPPFDERVVSSAIEVGSETTVRFPNAVEPRHRAFEVCLKLAPGFGPSLAGWNITGPGGRSIGVHAALQAEPGVAVPFEARSFRSRPGETFACFAEDGAGPEAPRRRYTSVTFRSDSVLPVSSVVLADYTPK